MAAVTTGNTPPQRGGTREILGAAWFIVRRNLLLVLWEVLGGAFQTGLAVIAAVLLILPVFLLAASHDLNTFGGLFGWIDSVLGLLRNPMFLVAAIGIVVSVVALSLAITAFVHGGIYGRIAHSLRPGRQRAGFWSRGRDLFSVMVGYVTIRFLLTVGVTTFGAITVFLPLVQLDGYFVASGTLHLGWTVALAFGVAATGILGLLVFMVRMAALGPLLLEGRSLFESIGDAAIAIGEELFVWLKLVFGAAILVSPLYVAYYGFSLLLSLAPVSPEITQVLFLVSSGLDFLMTVGTAAVLVFFGAAFLVQYAWTRELVTELPSTAPRPMRAHGVAGGLQLPVHGRPMTGHRGLPIVAMPMPRNYGNVQQISKVFDGLSLPETPPNDPSTDGEMASSDPVVGELAGAEPESADLSGSTAVESAASDGLVQTTSEVARTDAEVTRTHTEVTRTDTEVAETDTADAMIATDAEVANETTAADETHATVDETHATVDETMSGTDKTAVPTPLSALGGLKQVNLRTAAFRFLKDKPEPDESNSDVTSPTVDKDEADTAASDEDPDA